MTGNENDSSLANGREDNASAHTAKSEDMMSISQDQSTGAMQTDSGEQPANTADPSQKSLSTEEYNEEYKKLNTYETNYKNTFTAIESQFNQIFEKISQFEDNLKEALATGNSNVGVNSNAEGAQS